MRILDRHAIIVIGSLFCLLGCTTRYASLYAPTSSLSGKGNIRVERFRYIAADRGDCAANQIEKTSAPIYFDRNIDLLVTEALRKELKFMGYSLDDASPKIICGEILEYSRSAGFLDYSFIAKINYRIYEMRGNERIELYSETHKGVFVIPVRQTSIDQDAYLYKVLATSIDSFVKCAQEKTLL